MGDLNRRMATAARQAVHNRNYRRARDRALAKLSHLYPDTYKQLLGIEKAIDEQEGKSWIDITGATRVAISTSAPSRDTTDTRETRETSSQARNDEGEA
jgi:hypothetical protein